MDEVTLVQYIGMSGTSCLQLLRLAFLNSFHQTGLKNLLVSASLFDVLLLQRTRHILSESIAQVSTKALACCFRVIQDVGIIKVAKQQGLQDDLEQWDKVDELPFDFERRRLSVLVRAKDSQPDGAQAKLLLICKVRSCT